MYIIFKLKKKSKTRKILKGGRGKKEIIQHESLYKKTYRLNKQRLVILES